MTIQHSGDRLKEELSLRRITRGEFARTMGVSPQTLNNWFARGVPGNLLIDVANNLGIGITWLHSGEGPRYWKGGSSVQRNLSSISAWDEETPLDDDEVEIPFLREVELDAGSGRFVIQEDEAETLRFRKKNLRNNGVQFNQAKCVTVRGNSMTPVLRDGATVGVDLGKTGLGDIIDGDLYALNHNGQLRIKQLFRLPSGIRLRSFNRDDHPDEDYTFQEMQEEQVSILGHIFWWGMYAR